MTIQQEEIKTIKPRNIQIKLSDADCKRLFEKAVEVGITVSELLEEFIGDLVIGTYSNGSDECMFANQWFERCGFGMREDEKAFLKYLVYSEKIDEYLELLDNIETLKDEIDYAEEHPEEFEPGEVNSFENELENWQVVLEEIEEDYKEECKEQCDEANMKKEIEEVKKWGEERKTFMEGISTERYNGKSR